MSYKSKRGRGGGGGKGSESKSPSKVKAKVDTVAALLPYQCIYCDSACESDDEENPIECFQCKNWAHKRCSGLNDQAFATVAGRGNLAWLCQNCEDKAEGPARQRADAKLDALLAIVPLVKSVNDRLLKLEKRTFWTKTRRKD